MDVALRTSNGAGTGTGAGSGLHHAVSLGNIEVSSKPTYSMHTDRSYDSEDENMGRRRLRHTHSTDLQPRTSVYSRGDIREQYCLTDRQLNSIERPRREGFFGCLSRRSAQQTFLGGCVGRRVPSDENLAAYAPFQKYPRYQNNYEDKTLAQDLDSSYFRRQPASILSTGSQKPNEPDMSARYAWVGSNNLANNNAEFGLLNAEQSSYHCPTYVGTTGIPPHQQGPATNPRTKHVSFARSHTLTSFDNVNAGFRSSGRMKSAGSQERLIGGKKPIIATGSLYETIPLQQSATLPKAMLATAPLTMRQPCMHLPGHVHQHHHAPLHIHQQLPDNIVGLGLPTLTVIPQPMPMPPSPEVIVVEKKFRNAMKTQATQTDVRKDAFANVLSLSPRVSHRIKIVSQGAQTNGLQNGKKLTKSLSEIPNGQSIDVETQYAMAYQQHLQQQQQQQQQQLQHELSEHDYIYRTDAPHESIAQLPVLPLQQQQQQQQHMADGQNNTLYFKPPPPLDAQNYAGLLDASAQRVRTQPSRAAEHKVEYVNMQALNDSFDYESNSLPRRSCTSHARTECDYYSNSLPRRADTLHIHDVCKHITECSELLTDSVPLDFTRPHLLPPPSEYCKADDDHDEEVDEVEEYEEDEEEQPHETESYSSEMAVAPNNRRLSMLTMVPQPADYDTPFRRDDLRRQSMPVYGQTEKLIDGFGPRSSFRRREKVSNFEPEQRDEKEIFIDFKPHVSPKPSPKLQHKIRRVHKAELAKQRQAAAAQAFVLQKPQRVEVLVGLKKISPPAVPTNAPDDEAADYDDEEEEEEEEDEDEHDDIDDGDLSKDYPVYENITPCLCKLQHEQQQQQQQQQQIEARDAKREQFRKRSVSLDDDYADMEKKSVVRIPSTPASPCREELLVNASTYPSSDSLANDNTRDHSDGIWNESQATVLTAEQKDISDGSYSSNLLLTPSSKRKNLLLQHQQRSSIDTDALDFEEQSPTYSMQTLPKIIKTPTTPLERLPKTNLPLPTALPIITPSIAVTPSSMDLPSATPHIQLEGLIGAATPKYALGIASGRSAHAAAMDARKLEERSYTNAKQRQNDNSNSFFNATAETSAKSADISECSTNTDEYATCTDTSKRTPGIKTPPTTTSSSSTTQVPVSTQSSQLEKTQAGSSFESASSLYSVRGDVLSEDVLQHDDRQIKHKTDSFTHLKSPMGSLAELTKKSPSHSISSTSSGSYNLMGQAVKSPARECEPTTVSSVGAQTTTMASSVSQSKLPEHTRIKAESISDDERSEVRYSSSGYYESPHDEDEVCSMKNKTRRKCLDDERKRRKTTMKLDIEKENLRALTSPVKKAQKQQQQTHPHPHMHQQGVATQTKAMLSPEYQEAQQMGQENTSPSKMKRFRPKIRRQLRKSSRDDSTPRRQQQQKNAATHYALPAGANAVGGDTEILLDASMTVKPLLPTPPPTVVSPKELPAATQTSTLPAPAAVPAGGSSPKHMPNVKSASEVCQLKAKSVESLRSVSPGSDSVFYSEADGGHTGEQHSQHCFHCGKEMEGKHSTVSELGGDSVESLPFIEQEVDIVKPPSDFADSPVTTKTTQRLYKKMDKRFRSEERYHGERGRLYKSRQENIRAKSEERGRENSIQSPRLLRPAGSSPCVLPDISTEQTQNIIYKGHYDAGRYARLTDADVWTQLDHQCFDRNRDRRASTESERSFHAKYQVILHRLVQRRCTLEMYHRQKNNSFRVDKTVVVKSDSGEFGFRIHGSKPVVVAAIEPETPAESSGLEVGDIIISVNGVQVLDKHHTEVVKIAHDGCETLELQVARTIGVLMHEQMEPPSKPIFTGYLWRQSGQAKGAPNAKKWVRRWFSLRPDNCLYYYKTDEDTQPVGAMIMAKHSVELCPLDIGKPHAFKVDSGEGIPMYVAADSEELASRWFNLLKQAASQDNQWLDKRAHSLYQTPNSILRPDCFGYLLKLGSRWCGWSKRYCVLKDACLYFYQDANSKHAFGMACLHGYKVASMSTNASGKKNSFEIMPPEPKLRHYYFCTESEMDKKRWVSALEYSIDRWIKSG